MNKINWLHVTWRIAVGFGIAATLVACQGKNSLFNFKAFKERAAETPPPSDENIEKTFFKDKNGKSKRFLCGWASETEVGFLGEGEFTHLYNGTPHCNIVFDIRKDTLVGLLVNPSFPEDNAANRKHWREYIEIPIVSHFYLERAKDAHGRETNEWIENSNRSHESARPMLKLNLAGIQFRDASLFWSDRLNDKLAHSSATDIEWDKARGFLGFTLNARVTDGFWGMNSDANMQAKLRVNFLEFQHDPTFKKTPYHPENSRHMNILHVMGRRHDVAPELYAAHWDFRQPVKLYINGVPDKEVEGLMLAAVNKWNQIFVEEGIVPQGQKAFDPIVMNLKHSFDLRYPTVTWVADRRISMNSSLGIGQAHADVTNGKIYWGSVTLWGGYLERLVNAYSQVGSGGGGSSAELSLNIRPFPGDAKAMKIPERLAFPDSILGFTQTNSGQLQQKLAIEGRDFLSNEIARLDGEQKKAKTSDASNLILSQIDSLKAQMVALGKPQFVATMTNDIIAEARKQKVTADKSASVKSLLEYMGFDPGEERTKNTDGFSDMDRRELQNIVKSSRSSTERIKRLRRYMPGESVAFPDQELTGKSIMASLARSNAHGKRSFKEIYDGMVMELALHELGHMLGMGHNFKENILPDPAKTPKKIFEDLKAKATAENGFTNLTTVMGYLSGRTWSLLDAKTVVPGPHDRLLARYLYRGEYSVYHQPTDKFEFLPLPAHGRIPEAGQVDGRMAPTSYFPQCNDIEASWDADPFCNRWDRGATAADLTKGYFEDLTDNLVSDLYSLIGGLRASAEDAEWNLWWKSFDAMARTRLFYDEMRLRLATDRDLKISWEKIRADEAALHEFSTACLATAESGIQSQSLRELFFGFGQKSVEIRDLCKASTITLNEMRFLLTLPDADYSSIDHKERYIMGGYLMGDAPGDYRHVFGKWYQLSNLPLKVASLFALTAPHAFSGFGWANPFYTFESHAPLYRSLYPREYTRLISEMVKSNLRYQIFNDADRTNLGHIILASSWLIPRQDYLGKDSGLLPADYERVLRNQTEFQFSIAAVLVSAERVQGDLKTKQNHFKRFTATMYDLMLDSRRSAREVYLLPKGQMLARVNDTFLYPLTQLRFLSDTQAYVIAVKVDYDYEVGDSLLEESVKFVLNEQHERVNQACIEGVDGSGLNGYFTSEEFEGFHIPPGIAAETITKEKRTQFFESLDTEFKKFVAKTSVSATGGAHGKDMRILCSQAMRGVGQISATAALLNGYWLGITSEFIK